MGGNWEIWQRPDRLRQRPNSEAGPAPSLYPHQEHHDPAHVLPDRHRRPLVRRQRQALRLEIPLRGLAFAAPTEKEEYHQQRQHIICRHHEKVTSDEIGWISADLSAQGAWIET